MFTAMGVMEAVGVDIGAGGKINLFSIGNNTIMIAATINPPAMIIAGYKLDFFLGSKILNSFADSTVHFPIILWDLNRLQD